MEIKRDKSPCNLQVSGSEWAEIRKKERTNFKRRVVDGLERMKWAIPDSEDDMNYTERGWKSGENEMLDGAIKFVRSMRL